jgi:hypothetical protein
MNSFYMLVVRKPCHGSELGVISDRFKELLIYRSSPPLPHLWLYSSYKDLGRLTQEVS